MIHRGLFDPGRAAKFPGSLNMVGRREYNKRNAVLTQFTRNFYAGLITESNVYDGDVRRVRLEP